MSAAKAVSLFAVTVLVLHVLAPVHVASARSFDRELLRKYFKCPVCDPMSCPRPAGFPNCQLVLEPGVCACCKVCARRVGSSVAWGQVVVVAGCHADPCPVTLTPWAPS